MRIAIVSLMLLLGLLNGATGAYLFASAKIIAKLQAQTPSDTLRSLLAYDEVDAKLAEAAGAKQTKGVRQQIGSIRSTSVWLLVAAGGALTAGLIAGFGHFPVWMFAGIGLLGLVGDVSFIRLMDYDGAVLFAALFKLSVVLACLAWVRK